MKYQLAIFDLDGTILDTLEDLKDSMNYTLRTMGLPERTRDEVRRFVGNGIRKLVERAVPEETDGETIDRALECFHHYYKDHCAVKTKPYDGIAEILRELRSMGIKTAVVSNKADYAVRALCEDYFPGLFDLTVGDREGQRRKPAPDSVNEVLKVLEIPRDRTIYIGDSEVDIATARHAEMDAVLCAWGFREEAYLREQGAETVIHAPRELRAFFMPEH